MTQGVSVARQGTQCHTNAKRTWVGACRIGVFYFLSVLSLSPSSPLAKTRCLMCNSPTVSSSFAQGILCVKKWLRCMKRILLASMFPPRVLSEFTNNKAQSPIN